MFGYLIPTHAFNAKYLNNYMEKIKPQNHHKCKEPIDHKHTHYLQHLDISVGATSTFVAVILVPLPRSS